MFYLTNQNLSVGAYIVLLVYKMEFTSPTYELLYRLESLGLYHPPKYWDLMCEKDIIIHIFKNTRRVDVPAE